MGLSCLPGSFTSRLLQDSLKERLWTRYQQITDRGTGPWPLGGPTRGALFPLTGLGSSTTEERTDAWGKERERDRKRKKNRQGGKDRNKETESVKHRHAVAGKNARRPAVCPGQRLWRGRGYSYRGRAELDQRQGVEGPKTGSVLLVWAEDVYHIYVLLSLSLSLFIDSQRFQVPGEEKRNRNRNTQESHSF